MSKPIPTIRPYQEGDLDELARLKREQGDTSNTWRDRFDWQFASNPARASERPLGWVLVASDDRLVGHQMAMPHRFQVLGHETYVGISTDTFAHSDFRGLGLGRKLFDAYFDAQTGGLAVSTTANPISERLWIQANAVFIGDLNIAYLYPFRSTHIVEEVLRRRFARLPAKGAAARVTSYPLDLLSKLWQRRFEIRERYEKVEPDDTALDEIWERHRGEYPITNVRDAIYRRWRYQIGPTPRPDIWLVTDPDDGLQGWFALRTAQRGTGKAARVCELLDVFGPLHKPEFQRRMLIVALEAARSTGADFMEVTGCHPNWRQPLSGLGFLRRKLPSNPFLCRNMGGALQALLEQPQNWHLVAADGDAAV